MLPDEDHTLIAQKFLGPVLYDDASVALDRMRDLLKSAGIKVTEEEACDD